MTASTPQLLWSEALVGFIVPPLTLEVTATTVVLGAMATRDYAPMHHDHQHATLRSGTRDIFLNTPHQAACFERYLTDWSGPTGRLGRMRFSMKASICPGDTLVIAGQVQRAEVDAKNCAWVRLALTMTVAGKVMTECEAGLALPRSATDNPWTRRGAEWQP